LKGWTVDDDDSLVEKAHLKRHPRHCSYIPISEVKPLTDAEAEAYDKLNQRLHDELRRASKEYFESTPIPPDLQREHDPYFTHFTYQNYDWYGPSYECYIVVLGEYLTADLLERFQSLLVGEYEDWCVQVVVSKSRDFDNDYEVAVFSDQIIVPTDAAKALGAPAR
jgi:hypothetical protein